jgi:3-keto-5-aminohexanoate cleavage enzyme
MSAFEDPVIISCSISGAIANREQCPAIPYTPEEYAAEARRAIDEGASQIHIHARTPDGVPSYEIEDFQAITRAILDEVGDVIVNYSTGAIGVPIEKRLEYLRALTPDVAALNMSSMNYAKFSKRRNDFVFKAVFENSFDTIIEFLTEMRELGIKPEHECFDAGHVANLDPLIAMGLVTEPHQISLVMGVTGGIRPTTRNVSFMAEQIPNGPDNSRLNNAGTSPSAQTSANWQVIGVSRDQWKLLGTALTLGGNVRAGLEDNLYLPNGEMARSNGELIAKARQMAEDIGRTVATVPQAREMLGLKSQSQALSKQVAGSR